MIYFLLLYLYAFILAKIFLFLFCRKFCCYTIKSLFTNEGKHGGEATVEAVRLISYQVKDHNCQLHPDSIEVWYKSYATIPFFFNVLPEVLYFSIFCFLIQVAIAHFWVWCNHDSYLSLTYLIWVCDEIMIAIWVELILFDVEYFTEHKAVKWCLFFSMLISRFSCLFHLMRILRGLNRWKRIKNLKTRNLVRKEKIRRHQISCLKMTERKAGKSRFQRQEKRWLFFQ